MTSFYGDPGPERTAEWREYARALLAAARERAAQREREKRWGEDPIDADDTDGDGGDDGEL